jgi:glycosyltransferase 2 family protein
MRKYRRLIAAGIILGLLAFVVLTLSSDVSQLAKYATAFAWPVMLLALGLRAGNWVLRFFKWHFYLRLVGVQGIGIRDSAAVFVSGFALAASPGKAAEVLKSFVLKNLVGTPVATTLPVVAAERLSDGIAVLLLLAWAAINLAADQYWPVIGPLVVVGLAAIAAGIVVLQIRPLCLRLLGKLGRLPLLGRFARDFELFYESSYRIVRLPNLAVAVGLGTVANLLDGVWLYLILVSLGQPAASATFFQALAATSLSVVTGSVSGSPGGIGASDLTITGTLQFLVKLSPSEAAFVTLLARFVQLWWGVLVGGVTAYIFRKRLFPPSLDQIIEEQQDLQNAALQESY